MNKGLRDTPRSRVVNEEYDRGYDAIFGKDHKASGTRRERTSTESVAPMVMGDIQPYKSPIDGAYITSRSQHRAHMVQHGVIEVGNEKLNRPGIKDAKPPPAHRDIVEAINQLKRR